MTPASKDSAGTRRALVFLAAVVAAVAAVVLGTVSSASAVVTAETRVGASDVPAQVAVGPPEHVSAGQRLGEAADQVVLTVATGFTARTATGADSALGGSLLRTHLRQLEKYGQGGFRELESGRFRYYGNLSPAGKEGDMVGRRLVREWDPASDATRTWHETIDRSGSIRIVRPETGGAKTHYYFDEFGNYGGAW